MTLSIKTFSIMTRSIMAFSITLRKFANQHADNESLC
jgi:hypothetical protein